MSVIFVQVFVSLALVAGSLVLFLFTVRQRDFEHADRLALAPLDDDGSPPPSPERKPEQPRQTKSSCKQNESNTTTL